MRSCKLIILTLLICCHCCQQQWLHSASQSSSLPPPQLPSAFQGDPFLHQPPTCDPRHPALAAILAPLRQRQQPEWRSRAHPQSDPSRDPRSAGSLPRPLAAQPAGSGPAAQQPRRGGSASHCVPPAAAATSSSSSAAAHWLSPTLVNV